MPKIYNVPPSVAASFVTSASEGGLSQEKVLGTDIIMSGTFAVRPAVGMNGRLYFETDNGIIWRDDGAAWSSIGTISHPALQNVLPNQHHAQAHAASGADHTGLIAAAQFDDAAHGVRAIANAHGYGQISGTHGIAAHDATVTFPFVGGAPNAVIGAGVTTYALPFGGSFIGVAADAIGDMPRAGTARRLVFRVLTAQPPTGSLVVTVMKNGVATAIVATMAASAAAGAYSDLVNSVAFAFGDTMTIRFVNNAPGTNTGVITTWSLEFA